MGTYKQGSACFGQLLYVFHKIIWTRVVGARGQFQLIIVEIPMP